MEKIEDVLNQKNVELLMVLHTKVAELTAENESLKAKIEQLRNGSTLVSSTYAYSVAEINTVNKSRR